MHFAIAFTYNEKTIDIWQPHVYWCTVIWGNFGQKIDFFDSFFAISFLPNNIKKIPGCRFLMTIFSTFLCCQRLFWNNIFVIINSKKRVAKVTSIRGYFGHQCNLMGKSKFFISLLISLKLLLNVEILRLDIIAVV